MQRKKLRSPVIRSDKFPGKPQSETRLSSFGDSFVRELEGLIVRKRDVKEIETAKTRLLDAMKDFEPEQLISLCSFDLEDVRSKAVRVLHERRDFKSLAYVSLVSNFDDTRNMASGYIIRQG